MRKPRIEEIIREMCEPITASLGLELVDLEYTKEGSSWFLRVFIDQPGGVTHHDCQAVSERLSKLLDQKDPIPQSYILEVSSPGLERPLKKPEDYVRFRGRKIRAVTFSLVAGRKEFTGELAGLEDGKILLQSKGQQIALPIENVAKVNLAADF